MPEVRLPELNKRAGVHYAVSDDGLELPVVDVTHPAFQLRLSDEQLRALVGSFLEQQVRFVRLPKLVRQVMLRWHLRGSIMARGLRRAEGGFLDGMTTYLFKLGAKNLGAFAVPADRSIAASLPGLSVRLRLADMAELLADAMAPRLSAEPGAPLHFLNIAGGPGIDSLNALLVLAQRGRELLADRRVRLDVLDRDSQGPAFGARALRALQAPGAPLAALNVQFRHLSYDWRDVRGLRPALDAARASGALMVASSEGGLFEYGDDEEIVANLRELGDCLCMVGSVTRDDETIRTLKLTSTATTKPRGLEAFSALIGRAGWRVVRSVARPLSDQVVIEPLARVA